MAYTAAITDVKTDCIFDRRQGETFSSLDIGFRATRAPSRRCRPLSSWPISSPSIPPNGCSPRSMYTVRFDFAPGATRRDGRYFRPTASPSIWSAASAHRLSDCWSASS